MILLELSKALSELAITLALLSSSTPAMPIVSPAIENASGMPNFANNNVPVKNESILYPRILELIAYCESNNRHFDKNGNVIHGRIHWPDIGRFQINSKVHGKTAEAMGIDLFSEEGNLRYALYLYKTQGLKPWSASKPCWSKKV